jgi:hypothetical protein
MFISMLLHLVPNKLFDKLINRDIKRLKIRSASTRDDGFSDVLVLELLFKGLSKVLIHQCIHLRRSCCHF